MRPSRNPRVLGALVGSLLLGGCTTFYINPSHPDQGQAAFDVDHARCRADTRWTVAVDVPMAFFGGGWPVGQWAMDRCLRDQGWVRTDRTQ